MGAEKRRTQARAEAAALLRAIAAPHTDPVKIQIARAADRLGWTYARTEDIWRQEAHRIEAWEMDALRAAAGEH